MKTSQLIEILRIRMQHPLAGGTPFLVGPPGVGKSAIVKQVSKELYYENFLDIRMSQHDATDTKGIPETEGGVLKWISPEFMPIVGSKWEGTSGVLFFDELNRAQPEVLQTVFEIVHDRRIGMNPILDSWFIIAAGNYGYEDGTDVVEMDLALKNRFQWIEVEAPTFSEWKEWAVPAGIEPAVINFLEENDQYLNFKKEHEFVTPRTWEYFSRILSNYKDDMRNIAHLIGNTYIGSANANFVKSLGTTSKITAKDILYSRDRKTVLRQLDEVADNRDIFYELNKKLLKKIAESDKPTRAMVQNFTDYFLGYLSHEMQATFFVELSEEDGVEEFVDKFFELNPDLDEEDSYLNKLLMDKKGIEE